MGAAGQPAKAAAARPDRGATIRKTGGPVNRTLPTAENRQFGGAALRVSARYDYNVGQCARIGCIYAYSCEDAWGGGMDGKSPEPARSSRDVADYIGALAKDMKRLAAEADLGFLAYLLAMAENEAGATVRRLEKPKTG
jgi:hypothetical protein